MPIDASIPLQGVSPSNALSQFVDIGLKRNQLAQSNATLQANIDKANADSSTAQSAATVNAANVPNLIQAQTAATQTAQTGAASAQYKLTSEQAAMGRQIAGSLLNDPDFVNGNTNGMLKKIASARQSMVATGIPFETAEALTAPLSVQATNAPNAVQTTLKNIVKQGNTPQSQANLAQPAGPVINNGRTTAQYNTNQFAGPPGAVPGTSVTNQLAPGQNETIQSDRNNNQFIVQRAPDGTIIGTRQPPGTSIGGAPRTDQNYGPSNLPLNETPQTIDALQSQRDAALAQVQNAGQLHQINKDIYNLASTDVRTGTLGALANRIRSAGAFRTDEFGDTNAADYNMLGKMLARSNQQLAQGMGPSTNAGLAQTNAANGTLDYDKNTLKNIAVLNDAYVTGTQLYQKGLEKSIQQNGIAGKRQYDQAWGAAFDPDAMKLKNAVDSGNQGQVQMIIKQVGGKGSAGAQTLFQKLQTLRSLSGDIPSSASPAPATSGGSPNSVDISFGAKP